MSIDQPHHSWLWITGHSAAEPSAPTFRCADCFRLGDEAGLELLSLGLQQIRRALPTGFHLADPVDGHHALGKLGFIHDPCLAGALDDGAGLVGASPGLSRPRGGDAARRGGWLRHLSQELPRAVHREVGGEVERA